MFIFWNISNNKHTQSPNCENVTPLAGIRPTHMVFRLVDTNEEEQLSDEEVDAEVFVDGVAVGLQAPQEAEGWDADG